MRAGTTRLFSGQAGKQPYMDFYFNNTWVEEARVAACVLPGISSSGSAMGLRAKGNFRAWVCLVQAKYASPFYGQYGEVAASNVLARARVRESAS